jgi:hypothetical protein
MCPGLRACILGAESVNQHLHMLQEDVGTSALGGRVLQGEGIPERARGGERMKIQGEGIMIQGQGPSTGRRHHNTREGGRERMKIDSPSAPEHSERLREA